MHTYMSADVHAEMPVGVSVYGCFLVFLFSFGCFLAAGGTPIRVVRALQQVGSRGKPAEDQGTKWNKTDTGQARTQVCSGEAACGEVPFNPWKSNCLRSMFV